MSQRDEVAEFLMGGGKSFPFDNIGDKVRGEITAQAKRQQTDMETGALQYWQSGEPKYMLVITLQTGLQEDEGDDGTRTVYLRGGNFTVAKGKGTSSLVAVRDAVKRAKVETTEVGGTLELAFTGEGHSTNKKFNAPKLYTAEYEPPHASIDINEMA